MTNHFTQEVFTEIESVEVACDVTYSYTKGTPAVMYQRNGDPGWPAEPPEIEVIGVTVKGIAAPEWFYRIVADSERIQDSLIEHHSEPEREYGATTNNRLLITVTGHKV